jgi:hypothetical protein
LGFLLLHLISSQLVLFFLVIQDLAMKLDIEIRKVQALTGERSLTLVLPKAYATELGIEKGNFLKCHIEDHKLVLEKTEL